MPKKPSPGAKKPRWTSSQKAAAQSKGPKKHHRGQPDGPAAHQGPALRAQPPLGPRGRAPPALRARAPAPTAASAALPRRDDRTAAGAAP